jgi:hemerythrin superfamily protein
MASLTPSIDIIDLLLDDHREAENLLRRFDMVNVEERADYFCQVVHELIRHEVAEELVVYPAVRSDSPGGDEEARKRLREQSEAENLLADMESIDATSQEFAAKFLQLRQAVLEHARAEETGAFALLGEAEDSDMRTALGARYEMAKASAPTHPHPHAPDTPPTNKIIGPIVALADKIRDAVRGI